MTRVFVAGHRGLVGSAIVRRLEKEDDVEVLTRTHAELDLTDAAATRAFLEAERPDEVYMAAAKVGGILANDTHPADFIGENLRIQTSIIHESHAAGVKKFAFLGSSCIYPREASQPIHEDSLLTGPLEKTNEWYAVAKIAGLKMCQAYRRQYGWDAISLMPTNLYGPGDNFDLASSHVLPALIRKFHEAKATGAKSVTLWGTGKPRREFLHADDLADAAVFLMQHYSGEDIVNVGWGRDIAILELAELIRDIVGFDGAIEHDLEKPDGTMVKRLDTTRLTELGWTPKISLEDGVRSVYAWFLEHEA